MTDELTPALSNAEGPLLASPARSPFNVRCGSCSHVWTAVWLPMEAGLFAKVTRRVLCPACGHGPKGIGVAPGAPVSPVPPQRTA